MKVLVTGGRGQLGRDLEEILAAQGHRVAAWGREELDVTVPASVRDAFRQFGPEAVVHAAAYTNVDGCESEPERAFRVNALGTRNVAVACQETGAAMVYVSTDYVFDGSAREPYTEFDRPNPVNLYGLSKLAGEQYVSTLLHRHFIVRTSWLYGAHGKNFVKTILQLARERDELSIVHDQVGCPTYSRDLASAIATLVPTSLYGIYHVTNAGWCSWFDFARHILKEAGVEGVEVRPITSLQLGRPARRPAFSVLRNYCLELEGLPPLRPWQEALREFLAGSIMV